MKIPDSLELLSKTKNIAVPELEEIERLPIPDPSYLRKVYSGKREGQLTKYEKEYEKYCQWSALPKRERNPKTAVSFERKWKIPKGYSLIFRERKDYENKRRMYFWRWMDDIFPEVIDVLYLQATEKGNTNAAKFFAEFMGKHIEVEKPAQIIQPLAIIGVPQDKIERLFTPKGYEDTKGIIPIDEEVKT